MINIQRLLDSVYLIPVILEHLDNPTDNTEAILKENRVSFKTINEARQIRHLLEYHLRIVQNNFSPNYGLLRQGLREYHDLYLNKMFNDLGIVAKKWWMLDYGAGAGQMSEAFLKANPESEVMMIDKEIVNGLAINLKLIQIGYQGYKGMFD